MGLRGRAGCLGPEPRPVPQPPTWRSLLRAVRSGPRSSQSTAWCVRRGRTGSCYVTFHSRPPAPPTLPAWRSQIIFAFRNGGGEPVWAGRWGARRGCRLTPADPRGPGGRGEGSRLLPWNSSQSNPHRWLYLPRFLRCRFTCT